MVASPHHPGDVHGGGKGRASARGDPGCRRGRLFAAHGADEAGTFARLKALRRELIEPILQEHGGRFVDRRGLGFAQRPQSGQGRSRPPIRRHRPASGQEHHGAGRDLPSSAGRRHAPRGDPDYGRAYAALGLAAFRTCAWAWTAPAGLNRSQACEMATRSLEETKRCGGNLHRSERRARRSGAHRGGAGARARPQ